MTPPKDWGLCQWCGRGNTCAPYLIELRVGNGVEEWEVCQLCIDRWNARILVIAKAEFIRVEKTT